MSGGWETIRTEDLAAAFGHDPEPRGSAYEPGDWFCVDHQLVLWPNGQPFSLKPEGGDGRRVLLGNRNGPNATMYARSASREDGVRHFRHIHAALQSSCKLNLDGWVLFKRRVVVVDWQSHLNDTTFSCREPQGSDLWADLKRARRL